MDLTDKLAAMTDDMRVIGRWKLEHLEDDRGDRTLVFSDAYSPGLPRLVTLPKELTETATAERLLLYVENCLLAQDRWRSFPNPPEG